MTEQFTVSPAVPLRAFWRCATQRPAVQCSLRREAKVIASWIESVLVRTFEGMVAYMCGYCP